MEGATLAEPRIPIRDGIALTYAARSSTLDRPPHHLDVTHRIALLLSAVLLSGCAVVPRSLVTASPSSSSAVGAIGRELGGVALGETQAQVAATLGEPTRKTISHGLGSPRWEYASGYAVAFSGVQPTARRVRLRSSPSS